MELTPTYKTIAALVLSVRRSDWESGAKRGIGTHKQPPLYRRPTPRAHGEPASGLMVFGPGCVFRRHRGESLPGCRHLCPKETFL